MKSRKSSILRACILPHWRPIRSIKQVWNHYKKFSRTALMTNNQIVLHAITVFPHVDMVTPLDNDGGSYCNHAPT